MAEAIQKIDYEMVALELGNALKLDVTIDKVYRSAHAILKIYRRTYKNAYISSTKAQAVYDYVLSLRDVRLDEEVKVKRLVEFIRALVKEDSAEMPRLLGRCGVSLVSATHLPEFVRLVQDQMLVDAFERRWAEVEICIAHRACLGAMLLMGGLLEGILLAKVMANAQAVAQLQVAPKGEGGKAKQPHEWSLSELIGVAHLCGWIENGPETFSQAFLNYKNYIHPWYQVAHGVEFGEEECFRSWKAVSAAIIEVINFA